MFISGFLHDAANITKIIQNLMTGQAANGKVKRRLGTF
jgi:hypothetical protein